VITEITDRPGRRSVLQVSGIALAGALARPGPKGTPPSPPRLAFGANHGVYEKFRAAIPVGRAVRIYYDEENVFPQAWPAGLPGAWPTLSIRPNPDDLLSGRLDDELKGLISTAPHHADLTFWHENTSGNPLGYPSYVNNPRAAVRMQAYGHRLCRGSRVAFGVITCGPAGQQLDWMAPGLDWWGDDLYAFRRLLNRDGTLSQAKIFERLDQNQAAWRRMSGRRWPAIRICESNSPLDWQRRHWFTWLTQWMTANNGHRIITYWNADHGVRQGGLSGPWPPSEPVIENLRRLAEKYRL